MGVSALPPSWAQIACTGLHTPATRYVKLGQRHLPVVMDVHTASGSPQTATGHTHFILGHAYSHLWVCAARRLRGAGQRTLERLMRITAVRSEQGVAQQTPQGGSPPGGRDLAGLKVRLLGAGWPGADPCLLKGALLQPGIWQY